MVTVQNLMTAEGRRWLILLVSPVAWMGYFVLVYLLNEASCSLSLFRSFVFAQVSAVIVIMLVLTAVTLALTLANGYLGMKLWRQAQASQPPTEIVAARDQFIGLCGLLLGGLFSILTLAVGAAVMVLSLC